jgi:hypothetical protein
LGITERTAFGIVNDLADAGYLMKQRDGRRNRYEIQHHLPLREKTSRDRTIGDLLDVLVGTDRRGRARARSGREREHAPERRVVAP